jgi:hypothetical protein
MAHSSNDYMRMYMRNRRAEERVQNEAESRKAKLEVLEKYLTYHYLWGGLCGHKTLEAEARWSPVPVTQQQKVWVPTSTLQKEADGRIVSVGARVPSPTVTAYADEAMTEEFRPYVDRVQNAARAEGVDVSEFYVKHDLELHLSESLPTLMARGFTAKMLYLGDHCQDQRKKLEQAGFKVEDKYDRNPRVVKHYEELDEWQWMAQRYRRLEEALENFAIVSIIANLRDGDILKQAKENKATADYFITCGNGPEVAARQKIQDVRTRLHPDEARILYNKGRGRPEDAKFMGDMLKLNESIDQDPGHKTVPKEVLAKGVLAGKKLLKARERAETKKILRDAGYDVPEGGE